MKVARPPVAARRFLAQHLGANHALLPLVNARADPYINSHRRHCRSIDCRSKPIASPPRVNCLVGAVSGHTARASFAKTGGNINMIGGMDGALRNSVEQLERFSHVITFIP